MLWFYHFFSKTVKDEVRFKNQKPMVRNAPLKMKIYKLKYSVIDNYNSNKNVILNESMIIKLLNTNNSYNTDLLFSSLDIVGWEYPRPFTYRTCPPIAIFLGDLD